MKNCFLPDAEPLRPREHPGPGLRGRREHRRRRLEEPLRRGRGAGPAQGRGARRAEEAPLRADRHLHRAGKACIENMSCITNNLGVSEMVGNVRKCWQ